MSTASGIEFLKHYADSDVLFHFWGTSAVHLEVQQTAVHFIINGKSWLLAIAGISPSHAKILLLRSNTMWKRTWLLEVYKHVEIFFGYQSWHAQIITSIFFYSFTYCPQIPDIGFAKCSAYYVLFLAWTGKWMFNSKVDAVKLWGLLNSGTMYLGIIKSWHHY